MGNPFEVSGQATKKTISTEFAITLIFVIAAFLIGVFLLIVKSWEQNASAYPSNLPQHTEPPQYVGPPIHAGDDEPTACTMEARLCPDGVNYVSRTGPNCEFSACPSTSQK